MRRRIADQDRKKVLEVKEIKKSYVVTGMEKKKREKQKEKKRKADWRGVSGKVVESRS